MLIRRKRNDKTVVFAEPPWNEDSPPWQAFDRELPPDHLARVVVEQLSVVDLTPLVASYLGTGSKPYRPDLLLRIALIEIQRGRHSPTQWYHDTKENTALQWAGFGIQPSRTCWHHFYDRAAPWLLTWNGNVLAQAQEQGQTTATRAAQDGTLVAANASRHQLLNHERLEKRLAQLDTVLAPAAEAPAAVEALAGVADPAAPQAVLDRAAPAAVAAVLDRAAPAAVAGAAPTAVPQAPPAWMADTPAGRQAQRQRYARARDHLDDLRSANGRRNPAKRLDPKKIVISAGDPQARPGRDKDKVFRPLYNVQLLSDLDAPFYLGYQVFAQTTDANTLGPMFERTTDLVGQKPKVLLVDAGYVTGADLALCDAAGVTVYGPWRENDYSKKKDAFVDKQQFTWLPDENAYRCPQGQLLTPIGKERRQHVDGRSEVQYRYRCAPVHCQACPLHAQCTSNPARGRSLRRSEHEDLITAHQHRMATPEAKQLYKLRKQTVERGFADWKEHRAFRRFWGRGMARAEAQVGFLVLAHNLVGLATAPTLPKNEPALAVTSSENSP